jgi:hypothetical protein
MAESGGLEMVEPRGIEPLTSTMPLSGVLDFAPFALEQDEAMSGTGEQLEQDSVPVGPKARNAKRDRDAEGRRLIRVRDIINAALPSDYDGMCDDANEIRENMMIGLQSYGGFTEDQARVLFPAFLRSLDGALYKCDWRLGYGKTRPDAAIPEIAVTLCRKAIDLVNSAFSSAGMRAYRNRDHAFIEAMAEFAEEAAGAKVAHHDFYTRLGQQVAEAVLDHKIDHPMPRLVPSGVDYEDIETAALEQLVYFIQSGNDGPIKIGIASRPQERLAGLQTGHHDELRMLCITAGGLEQERAYHAQFAEHRIRGEWFSPHPDILAEIERLTIGLPHVQ